MEVLEKLPATLKERAEMGETVVRYPASPEDFFALLAESNYKIEYHNGEIISIMPYASDPHELVVSNSVYQLHLLLEDTPYLIYPSNRPITVPGYDSYYNADAFLVKGEQKVSPLTGSMTAVTNPSLIIEVLSDSTRTFDQVDKLENYRKIPTLQQVIFVDSTRMHVTVHRRTELPNQWIYTDFEKPDDAIAILDEGEILLSGFYKKVTFAKTP